MIHVFKQNGFNVCLDINSGTVHIPDDIAYDILCRSIDENAYDTLKSDRKYGIKNIKYREVYSEIDELIKGGSLFSDMPLLSGYDENKDVRLKALCLHMAHTCNLKCSYCFAGDGEYSGGRSLMPLETAKKSVDLLLSKSGHKKNIEIDFFGGEPMLNFDTIKKTVEYTLKEQEKYGKTVHFTITTNATIMSDEDADFINKHMDNVVLSLDGRKHIHDKFRRFGNGKGSYDEVLPNIKKIIEGRKGKSYFVRGTYTGCNLDFSNDVKHIAALGFKEISIEPVTGGEFELTSDEVETAAVEYEKFAAEYALQSDYRFYHFNINLYNSPCIFKRITACGAGFEYGAVTPDGEIYACHRLVGVPEFKMGTVFDGELSKELAVKMKNNNVLSIEKCKECWAKFFCSGGCPATAFYTNGSIDEPDEKACILQKKRIECALAIEVQRIGEKQTV